MSRATIMRWVCLLIPCAVVFQSGACASIDVKYFLIDTAFQSTTAFLVSRLVTSLFGAAGV